MDDEELTIARIRKITPLKCKRCPEFEKQVAQLEAEVKKLNAYIRADAIRVNYGDGVYQEAVHYTWLDDENERLEKENAELKLRLEEYDSVTGVQSTDRGPTQ